MMTVASRVLAIVPARGGSKGLPGKNLRPLCGRPLIVYTLEAARAARTLGRVIVSTDDPAIAAAARTGGAEVPFMRPVSLAADDTPTLPVLQHAVRELSARGYSCDVVVTLQPTSPLRLPRDIDEAVDLLLSTGCESVVSVVESPAHPSRMRVIRDGVVQPLAGDRFELRRRHEFEPIYAENGAVYVTRRDVLMERGVILGDTTRAVIMPRERSIDVDDELDLQIAEMLLRQSVDPVVATSGYRDGQ